MDKSQAIAEIQKIFADAGTPITAAQTEIIYAALAKVMAARVDAMWGGGRIARVLSDGTPTD